MKLKLVRLIFCIELLCLIPSTINAQLSDSITALKLWAYADIYYNYDFNKPSDYNRPAFVYAHNRHNEFALNNIILGVKYTKVNLRANFALHTGTYVRANYAAEPDLLRLVYEANAGFKVAKNIWLDAGIFASHIGAESAISMDNLTLSRSIMADNTPYYESGIKLTFTPNDKILISGLVLNGWQNIVENNDNKAICTQIQIKPFTNFVINSSTFFGKEKAAFDTIHTMRYFHNWYAQIDFNKISFLAAFDIGIQDKSNTDGINIWYNPNLITKLKLSQKSSLACRMEFYSDKKGIIINTGTENGFQTFSPSINYDFKISENLVWRLEAKYYKSMDNVFIIRNNVVNTNTSVLTSLAFKL